MVVGVGVELMPSYSYKLEDKRKFSGRAIITLEILEGQTIAERETSLKCCKWFSTLGVQREKQKKLRASFVTDSVATS